MQKRLPSVGFWDLLRNDFDVLQSRANIGNQRFDGIELGVQRCQVKLGLSCMANGFSICGQQQGVTRGGLQACARGARPGSTNQGSTVRRGLAAVDVLRGEAAQAPFILQLIKPVLAIGPITVELCH